MREFVDRVTPLFSPAEPVSIPVEAALERVCRCVREANEIESIASAHQLVEDLALLAHPASAAAGEQSRWQLKISSVAGFGKTLFFQASAPDGQELTLSLDAKDALYLGSWRSLKPGETEQGFVFHLDPSPKGDRLVMDDGRKKKQLALGAIPAFAGWVSLAGFLGGIQTLVQPEAVPTPRAQPAASAPLAPHCGPVATPVFEASTVLRPPQPVCPRCGTPSQPGTRFCSQCGAPVSFTPSGETLPPSACLVSPADGRVFSIQGNFSIGRSNESDLCLQDPEVSRNHALIEPSAGGWWLRDLQSSNGTRLNGERISAPAVLKPGDLLQIGSTTLRFEMR